MAAAEPGAMVDSSTSKSATAKRVGAFGSTGAGDEDGEADEVARGVADGAPDAAGARCGVTV